MTAKFPNLFRCGINYNPVVDIYHNMVGGDIPEWSSFEVFKNLKFNPDLKSEEVIKIWNLSPISMNKKIETSILLVIGGKDQRCVPTQSIFYYKMLKEAGVDIKINYYPDEGHSLRNDIYTVMDDFVNYFAFLDEKLTK